MRLVTVAHGTRLASGNQVARDLTAAAGARLGLQATAAYVELCRPSLDEVLESSDEPTVVVPLLLSTGHHVRHDLPAALSAARGPVVLGPALGPHRLLAQAQAERLLRAGATPGQPVVLVAAGSRDPLAARDLSRAARHLAGLWRGPVTVATLGGPGTRPGDLVTPDSAVSPYLLADGHFADRLRETCSGAGVVADVIGPHPAVVALVAERAIRTARAARRQRKSMSSMSVSAPSEVCTGWVSSGREAVSAVPL
jgi:sirohydrochlorin ferrochelatase